MRMLGPQTHTCPYGRSCVCNPAPGKERKITKRVIKRREKQQWKREVA